MACEGTSEFENLDITCRFGHHGSTLGFYNATAVTKPTALTAVDSRTLGVLFGLLESAVLDNTRTRLVQMETKLQALGLLS